MAAGQTLKATLLWGGRLVLGGTFAYASVNKILDPRAFAADIDHYHILAYPLTAVLAAYLPWLELVCGIGVIFRWREQGALLLTLGMCAVFTAALGSAWYRGLDINCGCFGHISDPSNLPLSLARSITLGVVALFLLRQRQ